MSTRSEYGTFSVCRCSTTNDRGNNVGDLVVAKLQQTKENRMDFLCAQFTSTRFCKTASANMQRKIGFSPENWWALHLPRLLSIFWALFFLLRFSFAPFFNDEIGTERQTKPMWQTSISMEHCREHFILHPDANSLHKGILSKHSTLNNFRDEPKERARVRVRKRNDRSNFMQQMFITFLFFFGKWSLKIPNPSMPHCQA